MARRKSTPAAEQRPFSRLMTFGAGAIVGTLVFALAIAVVYATSDSTEAGRGIQQGLGTILLLLPATPAMTLIALVEPRIPPQNAMIFGALVTYALAGGVLNLLVQMVKKS